jgi:hypothetical protein
MKKIKLLLLFLVLGIIILSACKKSTLDKSGSSTFDKHVSVANVTTFSIDSSTFGECAIRFADSTKKWIQTYGAGGPKQNDVSGAANKMFEISVAMQSCGGSAPPNNQNPVVPAYFFDPPVFEEFFIQTTEELLGLLDASNLCDASKISIAKAKVAPLNVIINRAIALYPNSSYYYATTGSDRMYSILGSFHLSEDYLLDDPFTLRYLITIANMNFPIPHIVAQKLFDLSPSFIGTPDGGGAYATLQRWNGFIIDCSQSTLTDANCYSTSTFTLFPWPLPSTIYYLTDRNLVGQYIPQYATSIFFNLQDEKYYSSIAYTSFVPNGYYDSPNDIFNISHKYYHIVDGVVTETLNVTVDPNGPVGP